MKGKRDMNKYHTHYYIYIGFVFVACLFCLDLSAQVLHGGYFNRHYLNRHDLNPAFANDSTYVSMPGLGNVNAKTLGNFGYKDVVYDNPLYPNESEKQLTTFMNPYLNDPLKGFSKGNNMVSGQFHVGLLSAGFKKWGGYNTVELNARAMAYAKIPYRLFEFAVNTGNQYYDIGDISLMAQGFAELAVGHSRQIDERLRLGAKVKILFGVAKASVEMNDVSADLMNEDEWTVRGDAQAHVSMKGFNYISETKEYEGRNTIYHRVNDIDVNGTGIGGVGLALDLGGFYRINDDWEVSASLLDVGFIHWSNDMYAINKEKSFTFDGFHDLSITKEKVTHAKYQMQDYMDQVTDFYNLRDRGDQGGRITGIGATLNLACEYTLPTYRQLRFGALSSTRLQGKHTWTEARVSANYEPLSWLDGNVSLATNSFTTSLGWMFNIHPKTVNFFIGMDHLLGKFSKEMIPLSSNASLSLGLNFTW